MSHKMYYIITAAFLFGSCNTHVKQGEQIGHVARPNHKVPDYVPNEQTAKQISEAIWLPIYGQSVLDEKPYTATLVGDSVWVVEGSLKPDHLGGTAYIEIRASDCKIMKVIHGK